MGRKMKATKSGKFINPTDQARKEARKRELRKNKKQRLLVRTAVLKGKDPFQIIADLERLDKMEFDINNSSSMNEKVLKDKRRKLKETWDRICRLYTKEDKDKYSELKRMESQYEAKRFELVKQFDAIKSTQEVNLDDIPLPELPMEIISSGPSAEPVTASILKTTQRAKVSPGCPQGPPPALSEFENEDDEDIEEDDDCDEPKKKIRFSDDTPITENESNLKEFLKEIEQLSGDKDTTEEDKAKSHPSENSVILSIQPMAPLAPSVGGGMSANLRMQPAPPILVAPPIPVPANPLSVRPNVSFPARLPAPPPRFPSITPQVRPSPVIGNPTTPYPNFTRKFDEKKPQVATIEAKPQLRNLSADSTKFMPLALRVKREDKQIHNKRPVKPIVGYGMVQSSTYSTPAAIITPSPSSKDTSNSKDNAYEQFIKEMQGLM